MRRLFVLVLTATVVAAAVAGPADADRRTPDRAGASVTAASAASSTSSTSSAPVGASSRVRRGAVALTLSAERPMAGERIRATVRLGTSVERPVRIQRRKGRSWTTIARGRSKGRTVTVPLRLGRPATVRALAPRVRTKKATYSAVASTPRRVRLSSQTAQLTGPPSVGTGGSAQLVAMVSPVRTGRRVTLERRTPQGFEPLAQGRTAADGRVTWTVAPTDATASYRAVAARYRGSAAVTSGEHTVSRGEQGPVVPQSVAIRYPVRLSAGSAHAVDLMGRVDAIQTLTPVASGLSGVSFSGSPTEGLRIDVASDAATGSTTLLASGTGCVGATCDLPLSVEIALSVVPLANVPGGTEEFTAPSADRLADAVEVSEGLRALDDEVIVTLGTPEEPGTLGRATEIAGQVGAEVTGALESIGVYELRWSGDGTDLDAMLGTLRGLPDVAEASLSTLADVSPLATPPGDWDDDGDAVTWPFKKQIRAEQAWDLAKGSSVKVGVIDTGRVQSGHEDLPSVTHVGPGSDLGGTGDCRDDGEAAVHGNACHATHVAGLACAAANGKGIVGAGWGCSITSAGLTDVGADSQKFWKDVLAQATAVARSGVRVANMSLGMAPTSGGCVSQSTSDMINGLAQSYTAAGGFRSLFNGATGRDVVWTLSAGNNCGEGNHSPMGVSWALPNVITVAASNSDKTLASFSNAGPGVEVAAPGGVGVDMTGGESGVISTVPKRCGFLGLSTCSDYMPMYGTSMAAPIVAGVAALAVAAAPGKTGADIGSCVVGSAGTRTGFVREAGDLPEPDTWQREIPMRGALPIVDAEAAVRCATGAPQTAEILVTGRGDRTSSGNGTDIGDVVAALTAAGHDVVNVSDLPASLAGYQQVWHVDTERWTVDEQVRVEDFVSSGRSVYLTGEWGCCSVDQSTIGLINALVEPDVWHVGGQGNGHAIAADAPYGLGSTPHALGSLTTASPGGLAGVGAGHVVAGSPDAAVFAAWGPESVAGGGRIAVIMDINWLAEQYRAGNWGDVLENIARFL